MSPRYSLSTSRPSHERAQPIDAVVARLSIFPFKSLPGVDVSAASLAPGGGFAHDREFALCDESGYVNGKREPKVHALRVRYDDGLTRAHFTSVRTGNGFTFAFEDSPAGLEAWLARHFGRPIFVRRNRDSGFPDDTAAPGPTIISTATLDTVAAWFGDLNPVDVGRRLRTNIEIGNVAPFWEDQLYGEAAASVPFRVGETILEGTNPCARCIVPARDPNTGTPIPGFAKRVAEQRAASLPAWAHPARFDHFYRLAVNTRAAAGQTNRTIHVADVVALLGTATPPAPFCAAQRSTSAIIGSA